MNDDEDENAVEFIEETKWHEDDPEEGTSFKRQKMDAIQNEDEDIIEID